MLGIFPFILIKEEITLDRKKKLKEK